MIDRIETLSPEEQTALNEAAALSHIRQMITKRAGDIPSILGTTADGAQLAVYGFAKLVKAISDGKSFDDVKQEMQPFADVCTDFLAKVDSGDVRLPFLEKGLPTVMADIEQRATAVAAALNPSKETAESKAAE